MRFVPAKLITVAGVLAAVLAPLPAAAELHAIVAGFNEYATAARLQGAVADAEDIAAVLARRGVRDIVRLTDKTTKVATFRSDFSDMVARAKSGDMVLFAFSGHGIRTPETRVPKRTPDGYDKGLLFPTYDQKTNSEEVLRDEDLYELFQQTAAKGLHILFVVDACHAGNALRGGDLRRGGGALKFTQFDLTNAAPVVPPAKPPSGRPPISGVAAITAQLAEKTVMELSIDGRMRGVLSYAVARGLEGAADQDHTGTITLDMLWQYTRAAVRQRPGSDQVPTLFAREVDGAMPILSGGTAQPPAPRPTPPAQQQLAEQQPAQPGLPVPSTVGVFAIGSPPLPSLTAGTFIADRPRADLIWDASREQILDAPGGVLASHIAPSGLQSAVDARRLLAFLSKTAEIFGSLDVRVALQSAPKGTSDDRIYRNGEKVRFEVASGPYTFLTAFDLNSNGEVQLLYPALRSDMLETSSTTPLSSQDPTVGEPYGADFVVFIRSEEPLAELHASFKHLKPTEPPTMTAKDAYDAVRRGLRGTRFRIGIQSLFTCREIRENGQCDSMLGAH